MKIIKQLLLEWCGCLYNSSKRLIGRLSCVISFCNPLISMVVLYCHYQRYQTWIGLEVVLTPIGLFLLADLIKRLSRLMLCDVETVPIARKRFIRKDENGRNIFSTGDIYEMVEYLAEVENYCERRGLYRKVNSAVKALLFAAILCLFNLDPLTVHAAEVNSFTEEEQLLLQQIALAEAEDQGIEGMALVMQVIVNRVESDAFPDTIYEVISQRKQFATYESGVYSEKQATEESLQALALLEQLPASEALYFENDHGRSNTWHSRNLQLLFTYKDHKFYK
jgi:N-acetylmuramoyl-L-alanine amidase